MRCISLALLLAFGESYLNPAVAAGSVKVAHIEVTQGLQDVKHTVPLIAGKRTFVRVFLDLEDQTVASGVTGTLDLRRPGSGVRTPVGSLASVATTLDPALNGKMDRRDILNRSLVFELPSLWIGPGAIVAQLGAVRTSDGQPLPCGNCATIERTIVLGRTAPLRLVLVGMRYVRGERAIEPPVEDYQAILSWIKRTYPVSQIEPEIRVIDWEGAPTEFNDSDCTSLNQLLLEIRKQDQSDSVFRLQHYYAVVSDGWGPGLQRAFMRGCANVPLDVDNVEEAVGSGPAGMYGSDLPDLFKSDPGGSYAGWYAAHELGHTFGRWHVSACGEGGQLDQTWPSAFAGGRIGTSDNPYIGFDGGDDELDSPMRVLAGDTGRDAMTYCPNQWISHHTFMAVCDRLNAENGSKCPRVAAAEETANASSVPSAGPGLGAGPGLSEPAASARSPSASPRSSPAPAETAATPKAAPVAPPAGPHLSVTGQLNLDANTGTISVTRLDRPPRAAGLRGTPGADTPLIRTYDVNGKLLSESVATVLVNADAPPNAPHIALVSGEAPYSPDVARIELVRKDVVIAQVVSSGSTPSVSQPSVQMPKLRDLLETPRSFRLERGAAPTDGLGAVAPPRAAARSVAAPTARGIEATQTNGRLTYRWSNETPTVPLSYTVQISTDNGKQWRTVAVKSSRASIEIDPTWIADADTIEVRVKASDGLRETVVTSEPLNLDARPEAPEGK